MFIRKPSPLHGLWKGFKIATIAFAQIYGIAFIVMGIIFLNFPLMSVFLVIHGIFAFWCGKSIESSLRLEEKKIAIAGDSDDEDQDPTNTLRPV